MSRPRDRQQAKWLKAFGVAVREARQRRGLSQEALGELARLDRTYVSGVERGVRNPTITVVFRLAGSLDTTPGALLRAAEGQGRET